VVGATDSQSPSGASRGRRRSLDMDEHRLVAAGAGMWVPGQPIAQVNWRFQWLWLLFTLSREKRIVDSAQS